MRDGSTMDELHDLIGRLRRQGTDDCGLEVKESASQLSKDVWDSVRAFSLQPDERPQPSVGAPPNDA